MMECINFEGIEKLVVNTPKIQFKQPSPEGTLTLEFGLEEGIPIIQITMPWRTIYGVGRYDTVDAAKSDFDIYSKSLKGGGIVEIDIIGNTAKILPKEGTVADSYK